MVVDDGVVDGVVIVVVLAVIAVVIVIVRDVHVIIVGVVDM